jgi:hypothetical protein
MACSPLSGDVFVTTIAPAKFYFCSATSTWTQITTGSSANFVSGATNLTNVGSVPFVAANGILNQDTQFTYDSTARRITVNDTNSIGGNRLVLYSNTSSRNSIQIGNSGYTLLLGVNITSGYPEISSQALISPLVFSNDVEKARMGEAITWQFKDTRATTGSTYVVTQAGAGQSTNPLQAILDSSGNTLNTMSSNGTWIPQGVLELTNQTGTISGTVYTIPTGQTGTYRISAYGAITTAGGAACVLGDAVTLTDESGVSQTISPVFGAASPCTARSSSLSLSGGSDVITYATAGTAITYSVTQSGTAGSLKYSYRTYITRVK